MKEGHPRYISNRLILEPSTAFEYNSFVTIKFIESRGTWRHAQQKTLNKDIDNKKKRLISETHR